MSESLSDSAATTVISLRKYIFYKFTDKISDYRVAVTNELPLRS